jgi:hypothetical protein
VKKQKKSQVPQYQSVTLEKKTEKEGERKIERKKKMKKSPKFSNTLNTCDLP